MNILILNWRDPKNPKSGGAETVTLEHAKAWVKEGHEVTWFASRFQNAKKEEVIEGVRIIRKGNAYTVHLFAPFFYFFSGTKFDIIIDEIHGIPFFTPLYVKKPKIAFIHEVAGDIWDYMYPFPFNIIGRGLEALTFQLYKNIQFITVSESTKKELLERGIHRVTVIPNGISIVDIPPLKKEHYPTFLFVSRIVKMKGIENILKAFSFIFHKDSRAKLWIVGDGDTNYISYLKQLAKQLQIDRAIIFYGRVSEKEKLSLMKRAHLLLHASVKEGWGLVVIEAASQGTPAVVYNASGLRDAVQNGKTGIVVNKNSPEVLAEEALSLVKDKKIYQIMQKEAYLRAKSQRWEESTKKSTVLLTSL